MMITVIRAEVWPILVLGILSAGWASWSAPAPPLAVRGTSLSIIGGVVIDTIAARPVPGVSVYVDGALRDSSDAEGKYRIKGLRKRGYRLRFVHPDQIAVFDGITVPATIEATGIQVDLDVFWPSIGAMVQRECDRSRGREEGAVALLGRVAPRLNGGGQDYGRMVATMSWSGADTPDAGAATVATQVLDNGGFLLCHLPPGAEVLLLVADPAVGSNRAPRLVSLPPSGFMTMRWSE